MSETQVLSPLARAQQRRDADQRGPRGNAGTAPSNRPSEQSSGYSDRQLRNGRGTRQARIRYPSHPQPITPEGSITVDRAKLVHEVTTGEQVRVDRHPVEDRPRPETSQEVTIPAEIVQKNVDFLRTYVSRWNEMANDPPPPGSTARNMLDHIFQTQADRRYADKSLLDRLSVIEKGPDGIITRHTVSDAQIREYLQAGEAWGETELAMEHFAHISKMALGIEETVGHKRPNRQTDDRLRHAETITEEDMRMLRGIVRHGISRGLAGIGTVAYFLGGRGTTELDFKHKFEIIDLLKASASVEDKAVILGLTGVDIDGLRRVPPGNGPYVPLQGAVTRIATTRGHLDNIFKARDGLFTALNFGNPPSDGTDGVAINRNRDTRTLFEFIYLQAQGRLGDGGRRAEGSLLVSDVKVMREFRVRYDNAVVVAFFPPPAVPPPGWEPPVGFYLPEFQQLQIAEDAIIAGRTRMARTRAERADAEAYEIRQAATTQALREKETQIKSGEYRNRSKEEQTRRRDAATTTRDAATERRGALQQTLGQAEQTLTQRQAELLGAKFGVVRTAAAIDVDVQTRVGVLNVNIDTALAAPIPGLVPPMTLQQLLAQRDTEAQAAANKLDDDWRLAATGSTRFTTPRPTKEEKAEERSEVERLYASRTPQISVYEELIRQRDGLLTSYREYDTALRALNTEIHTVATQGERNVLLRAETDHMGILALGPAIVANANDLYDTPAYTIVQRLADAGLGGANDAERLQFVLRAKEYEQMTRTARLNPVQTNGITAMASIAPPFTVDELVRTPVDDLANALTVAGYVPGPPLFVAGTTIQQVAQYAYEGAMMQRQQFEHAIVNQEVTHYDAVVRDADARIRDLENPTAIEAMVRVALDVTDGQEDVFSRAQTICDVPRAGAPDPLLPLGNGNVVNNADPRLTPAERTSGLPQGVLEWYGFLDPAYQNAKENREELFQALRTALPPEQLATIINDEFELAIPPGPGFVQQVIQMFGSPLLPRPSYDRFFIVMTRMIDDIRRAAQAV